ncbi:hypothetical protein H6F89_14910 [Cyanobacteria bacterium FACHB-63]|nr:hypothetical protein [Cyanobacteria bacterium FACHB-63]
MKKPRSRQASWYQNPPSCTVYSNSPPRSIDRFNEILVLVLIIVFPGIVGFLPSIAKT